MPGQTEKVHTYTAAGLRTVALRQNIARNKLTAVLGNDKAFWGYFTFVVALIALLRGVRLPSLWGATQSQFDYSMGFIKRGLYGELMDMVHVHNYVPFAVFSYLVLGALIVLLWHYYRAPGDGARDYIVAAVFFSSLAFTYIAHLVGYLDISLALLAVATLLIPSRALRTFVAVQAVVAGIMIHEIFLVIYMPLLFLDLLLLGPTSALSTNRQAVTRYRWYAAVLPVLALSVALGIARVPSLTHEQIPVYFKLIEQKVDFPPRSDVFEILGRSVGDNLAIVRTPSTEKDLWHNVADATGEFAPSMIFLLALTFGLIDNKRPHLSNGWLKLLAAAVSLSPLGLNVLAIDVHRWYALSILNAFLVLAIFKRMPLNDQDSGFQTHGPQAANEPRTGSPPAGPASTVLRNAAILLIALNLSTGSGLMDDYTTRTFPFLHMGKEWIDAIHHRSFKLPKR